MCEGYLQNSLQPISYFGYVLSLKNKVFCRTNNQIHFPIDKGLQCSAKLVLINSLAENTGWRHFVDSDISWTLFFKVGDFSWTLSKGDISWTLFFKMGDISWTILVKLFSARLG